MNEGQRITEEINADPDEVRKLLLARAEVAAGKVRPWRGEQLWYIDYPGFPAEIWDPHVTYTLHQLMVMTPILQRRGYRRIVFSTWNPRP